MGMRLLRTLLALMLTIGAVAGCDGDDGGGGSAKAFCAAAEDIEAGGGIDAETTDEEALGQLSEAFEQLEEQAPDEIHDDVETYREALAKILEGDIDDLPSQEEAQQAQAAVDNVNQFVEAECGIETGPVG
jgi:hypothetical protein